MGLLLNLNGFNNSPPSKETENIPGVVGAHVQLGESLAGPTFDGGGLHRFGERLYDCPAMAVANATVHLPIDWRQKVLRNGLPVRCADTPLAFGAHRCEPVQPASPGAWIQAPNQTVNGQFAYDVTASIERRRRAATNLFGRHGLMHRRQNAAAALACCYVWICFAKLQESLESAD